MERRQTRTHKLKTWPEAFQAVLDGRKRHEVRVDDRGFQVGDELELKEWDPSPPEPVASRYTGRKLSVRVTYISVVSAHPGQPRTVALSIRRKQAPKPPLGPPEPGSLREMLTSPAVAKMVQDSVANGVVGSEMVAEYLKDDVPRGTPASPPASEEDTAPTSPDQAPAGCGHPTEAVKHLVGDAKGVDRVLWCAKCGSIAKIGSGLIELYGVSPGAIPGSSAWLRPPALGVRSIKTPIEEPQPLPLGWRQLDLVTGIRAVRVLGINIAATDLRIAADVDDGIDIEAWNGGKLAFRYSFSRGTLWRTTWRTKHALTVDVDSLSFATVPAS